MNTSSRAIGIVLVVIGVLALIGQAVDVFMAWPLIVVAVGAGMLVWALLGRRRAAGLAVPGSIVTTVGLILLIQSATGTFHTWAYAWGLVLASVGFGAFLQAAILGNEDEQRSSLRLTGLGLALFAGFGIFFEVLIFGGLAGWMWRYALPAALILMGAYLLVQRRAGMR